MELHLVAHVGWHVVEISLVALRDDHFSKACRVSREHQDWFVEMLERTAARSQAEDAEAETAPLPSA